jgi:hypothetical protein
LSVGALTASSLVGLSLNAQADQSLGADPANPDFGPNVIIFDPSMPQADIQAKVDQVYSQQQSNEMGTERYSLLFKPGEYGTIDNPLLISVGYYTEVAGVGQDPTDVIITGGVTAHNPNNSGSLTVFWRSVSNLTIKPAGGNVSCFNNVEAWAASQAAPMRRVNVIGNTTLMPYCDNPNYASGGFIADSKFTRVVDGDGITSGSQQQYYVRNSEFDGPNSQGNNMWSNGVWNQVFTGVTNAPAHNYGDGDGVYSTVETSPLTKEKPYLFIDDQGLWNVFVPEATSNSSGTTWSNGHTPGTAIPLSKFYLAHAGDSPASINAALSSGLNLMLSPGVYQLDASIEVNQANTVVFGMGYASLTPTAGNAVLSTGDVPGIDISGITADAGLINSPVLIKIGQSSSCTTASLTALHDVFFRVGGPHVGNATIALEVNRDLTLLDHLWIWRADHGIDPTNLGSDGQPYWSTQDMAYDSWQINTSDNGLVVNGDNVIALGLFVEHFQKENVLWNGNGGQVIFYQNELPYDAPNQEAYRHDDQLGYPAFKVADDVTLFEGLGLGSYIYSNVNPDIHVSNALEVPLAPGVTMRDMVTINLSGPGTIDHVINGVGDAAVSAAVGQNRQIVVTYPASPPAGTAPEKTDELELCGAQVEPTPEPTPSPTDTPSSASSTSTAPDNTATPGAQAATGGQSSDGQSIGWIVAVLIGLGAATWLTAKRRRIN